MNDISKTLNKTSTNFYIGIDIGTSATKSVLFDAVGNVISSVSVEYNIISPKIGYAEEDPKDWYNATIKTLSDLSKVKIEGTIRGIGLSGQMHGLVILDKDDNPIRNSIIWCDNRTDSEAKEIESKIERKRLIEITGNVAMPAFTLAKLLWVKNNEPENYKKISKVMTPKDYIRYMLTKSFYGEYSDASGMQILDLKKKCYSEEILNAFEIPLSFFPSLKESCEITGYLTQEIERLTNLKNVFVVGGASDQAAGAIGAGIINANDVSIVLGSSGVVFAPTNKIEVSKNGEFQTFFHAIKNTYHIMGVTNGAGTSLKWCRNSLYDGTKTYDEILSDCEQSQPGANGLFYLPYLMGERTPHLDPDATGCIFGIRNTTQKNDIARSIIEGVSYSLKECYELIPNDKRNVYISGGGAKSRLWKEIIASMIKNNLHRISQDEGPALGVAILAMVAKGEYSDIESACKTIIKDDFITKPNQKLFKKYEEGFIIYKELYQANKLIFKKISKKG